MCLILFAWRAHPRYPLIVAANRDEFHERPTRPACFWPDAPHLLAGKDLRGGGTWLGLTTTGRFAALTNFREPGGPRRGFDPPSRGELVTRFLLGDDPPAEHAERLRARGARYDGFNLLIGTPDELYCVSNRAEGVAEITPGVHALSNHLLDTQWPKARHGRAALSGLLETPDGPTSGALLDMLDQREPVGGEEPPAYEPTLAREQVTRLVFIASEHYGTRSSTVVLLDSAGRVQFTERSFGRNGNAMDVARFSFAVTPGVGRTPDA